MYIGKCPLRISLVGGSTDLESFMEKYGKGSVISFPSNLFCYISVHKNNRGKYIVNYSKHEEVEKITDIKNDIARVVLEHFQVEETITMSFNTDIPEGGSGLASSSSYLIAAIKAVSLFINVNLSDFEICKLALLLERKFNPLTGFQDSFGCGIGGFKKIECFYKKDPVITFLKSNSFFSHYNLFLYDLKQVRKSTEILTSIKSNNCLELLQLVDEVEGQINNNLFSDFEKTFKKAWEIKKSSSSLITTKEIEDIEKKISSNSNCLTLCVAGGGGFFLVFIDKNSSKEQLDFFKKHAIEINICNHGVQGYKI